MGGYNNIVADTCREKKPRPGRPAVKNVGFLPSLPSSSLYVEDPFDSVHIQRPPPAFPAPSHSLPPPPTDIYNLAAAVLHIFPRAVSVFPREIHWQGNCTKAAAEKGQPAARWRSTERANTRVRFVERSCRLQTIFGVSVILQKQRVSCHATFSGPSYLPAVFMQMG